MMVSKCYSVLLDYTYVMLRVVLPCSVLIPFSALLSDFLPWSYISYTIKIRALFNDEYWEVEEPWDRWT
jgi:hypothetical protein